MYRCIGRLVHAIILISFPILSIKAQFAVTGKLTDVHGLPIEYANALVFTKGDSVLVKGTVSREDGSFSIENLSQGTYMLRIIMTGYEDYSSQQFDLGPKEETLDFGTLILPDLAVLMNEVQVVAKRPLFEQKIDRMVVNVANSITSSGTNALEVLERSPGVIVNRQSNLISVSGKSGVVVMINGRINYMPADAVVHLLEGMSADNIERIEIITTPPAGLDAEGNAGYINIVLKRAIDDGFNGSYGLSLGYGKGETGSANLNFNYRKGKVNLYGDYSYLYEAQDQVFSFYRSIELNGEQLETDTESDRFPVRNNHNARVGMDYQVTPKTVVGLLVSGYNTKWEMEAINNAMLSSDGQLDSIIVIDNTELNQWKHLGGNFNVQHNYSENRKLTFDFDYLHYNDNNPTEYTNTYYDGAENVLYETYTRSTKMTPISITAGKFDYLAPVGSKIKMEAGAKAAVSHFINDVGVQYNTGQGWVPQPDLTAKYDLDESILAAYVSFDASLNDKTSLKFGLRYEYTDSNLGSGEEADIVDRQFGELFPTCYISRKLNENSTLNFSYGKRINRPTFKDMAPFTIFIDPYTFFSGNPALQPSIAHNLELSYQFKSALVSLKYSVEDSVIANFQSTIIEGTNTQLIYAENLKQVETISATIGFPVTPFKWWNMNFNINGVWQEAQKHDEGELKSYTSGSANFFTTQTITLPKDFTFEVTGYYGTGGLFGIFEILPYGGVSAGLQKKFQNNGGTLRLGVDDIFDTAAYRDELSLPEKNEYYKAYLKFGQRTIKLSYTRNFGSDKVKSSRSRETGAEDEKRRVN